MESIRRHATIDAKLQEMAVPARVRAARSRLLRPADPYTLRRGLLLAISLGLSVWAVLGLAFWAVR